MKFLPAWEEDLHPVVQEQPVQSAGGGQAGAGEACQVCAGQPRDLDCQQPWKIFHFMVKTAGCRSVSGA